MNRKQPFQKRKFYTLLILMLLSICHKIDAQQSIGIANTNAVINRYAPVTARTGNIFTLGATQGGAAHTWAVGDYVMIIQMTGSTSAGGGLYQICQITAVSGSNITVNGTIRAYDSPSTEKIQMIWVPYSATGWNTTSNIAALPWNGTVGGVVALKSNASINLGGAVLANAAGYRSYNSLTSLPDPTINGDALYGGGGFGSDSYDYGGGGGGYGVVTTNNRTLVPQNSGNTSGGVENSGILGLNGVARGVGPGGNDYGGGGGGGGHAGGGGGGSGPHGGGAGGGASPVVAGCGGAGSDNIGNIGGTGAVNGNNWTNGTYVGGGGGYTGGPGGGGGGFFTGGGGGQPLSPVGFLGGGFIPITGYKNYLNETDSRLFMGGAGAVFTDAPIPDTKSGGGIILLDAPTISGNNKSILANGSNGSRYNDYYTEGGGAGGSILVTAQFTSHATIAAVGGNGVQGNNDGTHGAGSSGGGGGGGVWINSTSTGTNINVTGSDPTVNNITFDVSGGVGGEAALNPKNAGFTSGGGCGGKGVIMANPNVCSPLMKSNGLCTSCDLPIINNVAVTKATCNVLGSITITGSNIAQYSIDSGKTWQTSNTFTNLPIGNYTILVQSSTGCQSAYDSPVSLATNTVEIPYIVDQDCSGFAGYIIFNEVNAQTQYSIDSGKTWSYSRDFYNLLPGTYHLSIKTEDDCVSYYPNNPVIIHTPCCTARPIINGLTVTQPTCTAPTSGKIIINTYGGAQYSIDSGSTWQTSNIFSNLPVGSYFIRVTNSDGCDALFTNNNITLVIECPSLGSTVFADANNNGIQDVSEVGIGNVPLSIYFDTNGNGLIDNGEQTTPIKTTTTDINGNYIFTELQPGNYQVQIPVTAFASGASLEFLTKSSTDIASTNLTISGTTNANIVDGDDNGSQSAPGAVVVSPIITLAVGKEPTTETGQGGNQDSTYDANGNMTVDFGFHCTNNCNYVFTPVPITGIVSETSGTGTTLNNAIGAMAASGAAVVIGSTNTSNVTSLGASTNIVLSFPNTIPIGSVITISLGGNATTAKATITDGVNTLNYTAAAANVLQRVSFTTGQATDSITISRTAGTIYVDGASYSFTSNTGDFKNVFGASIAVTGAATFANNGTGDIEADGTTATTGASGNVVTMAASNILTITLSDSVKIGKTILVSIAGSTLTTVASISDGVNTISFTPTATNTLRQIPFTMGKSTNIITVTQTSAVGSVRFDGIRYSQYIAAYNCAETCTPVLYSLGNRVFLDTNNSGNLDGAETGIDGVKLQLLNADGSVYDSDPNTAGIQADTVTTGNGGYYRFDDLTAGSYMVEVLASNFASTLLNYNSSTGNSQEVNPNADVDNNDNGLDTPVSGAVRSGIINLSGAEPTSEPIPASYPIGSTTGTAAADTLGNLTVDFGFYPAPTCAIANDAPVVTNSTCAGPVTNPNGSIVISNITGADKFVFNTSGGTGLTYSTATTIAGSTISLTGLTNGSSATTYTIRIFNGNDTCFKDIQVVLAATTCSCPPKLCIPVSVTRN